MKKLNRINYNLTLFVSAIILFGSLFGVFLLNTGGDERQDPVRYGILDLSQEKDISLINLDGAWEFYPNVFLTEPEDFPATKTYVRVPGKLSGLPSTEEHKGLGGTYRLTIKIPEDGDYGIKSKTIRNAARVILNGEESYKIGNPALEEAEHVQGSRHSLGFVRSENKEIEIIIHSSSHIAREGGIIKSIVFGNYKDILQLDRNDRALDGLVIVICAVIAIHSVLSWSVRPDEKFLLYAGLTSLLMGLYYSTIQEQLITTFLDYDLGLRIKLQAIITIMLAYVFMKFIQAYYKELNIKKIVDALSLSLLGALLLIGLIRGGEWFFTTGGLQGIFLAAVVISLIFPTLVLMGMVLKGKEKGYGLILGTVLFTFELVIAIKILFEMEFAQIPAVLMVIFNFSLSLLMQNRLQEDKAKAQALSDELIKRDKMKDDFLARTSHELRTPLHTIVNLSSLMMEGEKGDLNIDQQEDMFFISMEGKRLSRLVDDLMDASTIGIDKIIHNKQKVFPGEIVASISKEYTLAASKGKDKEIEIVNEIPEDFPAIYVDLDRFIQVIVNLLDNAIKFSENGSIKITGQSQGKMGSFTVEDSGLGISPEDLPLIFDSFYRAEKNEETGLGLGLTIVKQIVEGHGGKVWAESELDQGSRFYFTLPLYDEVMAEKIEDDLIVETPDGALNPEANILVVDDEPSHIKVLNELLKLEGYRVFTARKGEGAAQIITEKNIDLAIIDVMLPDISGDQVCNEIRKDYSMTEFPIIMITASGRASDLSKSFDSGANDFIKKPADPKELRSRVRSLLLMKESYKAGLEKEFNYFYSQLSPHFIYNTLNAIIGISYSDTDGARKALENLGTYLRMKMDSKRTDGLVDLSEELELVTVYSEIEKLRYGERFQIEVTGGEDLEFMLPPLTLQPLVENSVRYGINHREILEIKIDIIDEEDQVLIKVTDNGPGIKEDEKEKLLQGQGKGTGLTNLIRRINILRKSSIKIEDAPGGGTAITIKIAKEF